MATEKTATKAAENKEAKAETEKAATKKVTKTWHITQRKDDKLWQVKAEGNEKATRTFTTKKEAEEFVKTLVANNKGSKVGSHKKNGAFQKK